MKSVKSQKTKKLQPRRQVEDKQTIKNKQKVQFLDQTEFLEVQIIPPKKKKVVKSPKTVIISPKSPHGSSARLSNKAPLSAQNALSHHSIVMDDKGELKIERTNKWNSNIKNKHFRRLFSAQARQRG